MTCVKEADEYNERLQASGDTIIHEGKEINMSIIWG